MRIFAEDHLTELALHHLSLRATGASCTYSNYICLKEWCQTLLQLYWGSDWMLTRRGDLWFDEGRWGRPNFMEKPSCCKLLNQ